MSGIKMVITGVVSIVIEFGLAIVGSGEGCGAPRVWVCVSTKSPSIARPGSEVNLSYLSNTTGRLLVTRALRD